MAIDGVTKAYPGVVANSDVSFRIRKGEVHALLGENGAGKSTLVKTIYGLVRPDAGTMTLDGQPYAPADPSAARQAGVAMVFQHFSLFDALSVAENIALGMETPPKRRVLARRIREVSEAYGLPLAPGRRVGDLSAGERQRVEIVRCLLQNPRLLIMDEPTSVLTPQEVEILFRTLRQLSAEGTAILYISHKLDEIRTLCDGATILRHGKVVGDCVPRETSARDMAEMMVAAKLDMPVKTPAAPGPEVLAVNALSLPAQGQFGTALKEIGFTVAAGEILGIGGVAGNGQDELFAVLSGETRTEPDTVTFEGAPVGRLGPHERRALGLLSAPEERLGHAAAPEMSLADNALMTAARRMGLAPGGWIDRRGVRAYAEKVIAAFDVRTPGPQTAAGALSGGNLQKFVVGREVMQDPRLLIVNQPTWGVDAAAAAHIRKALIRLAEQGAALIVISQDLDELMEISDRITAICDGRMVRPRPAAGLGMNDLGLMLGGRDPEEEAAA
nr:ABC transporter ATP-binding protein [Mangrovicoccus algicola]